MTTTSPTPSDLFKNRNKATEEIKEHLRKLDREAEALKNTAKAAERTGKALKSFGSKLKSNEHKKPVERERPEHLTHRPFRDSAELRALRNKLDQQ